MIISDVKNDVSVGGAQSVNAFTIKASAKAFEILSSNLYSNKIGSMIRELSTNAYDAHIMVNKADEPFIITLPNKLEPTFKIRDFGPGLSEQDILTIYTTFFESTKTDSNDVVGCLGLGSKSPFGISDSFTINSYYNGKKSIYSAFLNDLRIPSIAKFIELQTDEPNGIEIEVAVKEPDFSSFSKEVNAQLKYFKTKPIILGDSSFAWAPEKEYIYKGSNWKLYKSNNNSYSYSGKNAILLQGQIAYPISTNSMGKDYDAVSSAVNFVLNNNFIFEVPIGYVNISPSREALSYDARTSKNIIAAAEKIFDELLIILQDLVKSYSSAYEARYEFQNILKSLGSNYSCSISDYIKNSGKICWNNINISDPNISFKFDEITEALNLSKSHTTRFRKTSITPWHKNNWSFTATPLKNTLWFYCQNTETNVEARVKKHVNDLHPQTTNIKVNIITTPLTITEFAEKMGLKESQIIQVSSLPKIKKYNRSQSQNSKPKTSIFKFNIESLNDTSKAPWTLLKEDSYENLTGFYVDTNKMTIVQRSYTVSGVNIILQGALELNIIDENTNIYGLQIPNDDIKHSLVNFFDFLKSEVAKIKFKNRYEFKASNLIRSLQGNITLLPSFKAKLSKSSPLYKLIDFILTDNKNEPTYQVARLMSFCDVSAITINKREFTEQVEELYPMFNYVPYGALDQNIRDYLLQMDKLREFEKNL